MLNMKKDILCYLTLGISIILFICTYVFLEPIPLLEVEMDYDKLPEVVEEADIYKLGLEKREKVQEKYAGEINIKNKWTEFVLMFTSYRNEFVEGYEKYTNIDNTQEKTDYENIIYVRYGINEQEDRDVLYRKFKNISNIVKIEVVEDTINIAENGINFSIKATDENMKEEIFNCTILNKYLEQKGFVQLKEQDIIEGEL